MLNRNGKKMIGTNDGKHRSHAFARTASGKYYFNSINKYSPLTALDPAIDRSVKEQKAFKNINIVVEVSRMSKEEVVGVSCKEAPRAGTMIVHGSR